jgi:imidazole glycerol-phosphate synthase subunit HisF
VACETLAHRIIACLDVDQGRVVKGVRFRDLRGAGDPAELAWSHSQSGADEIVFLDITATSDQRAILIETVKRTARELFIPLTVGGGVRSLKDASNVFDAGADKVAINSAAISNPALISEIARRYGSQAVVVAVDAKRGDDGGYELFASGGRIRVPLDALAWVREAQERGAGEILVTSMDRDGTAAGFDCKLTSAVARAVHIPVIASGGAGSAQHFIDVFSAGLADAALAASIFHFGIQSASELKASLCSAGIAVRWPC